MGCKIKDLIAWQRMQDHQTGVMNNLQLIIFYPNEVAAECSWNFLRINILCMKTEKSKRARDSLNWISGLWIVTNKAKWSCLIQDREHNPLL